MSVSRDEIKIVNAREHNLRDVSVSLPKGKLICFTGVSGSGKSSLAFDTLYAEGQRRYIESLSSYARQFLGELPKPDVDQITGLAPSISIQQKTSGWNPRSTVGTITQITDYLRVLFARAGTPHCPTCGEPIRAQTREQMADRIFSLPAGSAVTLLAPRVRAQKGEHRDVFSELASQGFVRARVDGAIVDLASPPPLDRNKRHDIDVVIDRLMLREGVRPRLMESLELALSKGGGSAIVSVGRAADSEPTTQPAAPDPQPPVQASPGKRRRTRLAGPAQPNEFLLSSAYACAACNRSFEPPEPQLFSFNSPQGMCPACDGLGEQVDFDPALLVPDDSLHWLSPCVALLRKPPGRWRRHIYEGVARHLGFNLKTPWRDLPESARHALLFGTGNAHIMFEWRGRQGVWRHGGEYEGLIAELRSRYRKATSTMVRKYYEQFMRQSRCDACRGARLRPEALAVRLAGRDSDSGAAVQLNLHEFGDLSIDRAARFVSNLRLPDALLPVAEQPVKEIVARLRFLLDVGLEYLTLNRAAPTLSGGESQRIRLASQIGSGLVGVLYVLDEPSIGLHPRDNARLLASLQRLRDMGNTVLVVEHDRDTMEAADLIVDFGPGPGVRGGQIMAVGSAADVAGHVESLTGAYLSGRREIVMPEKRRPVAPPTFVSASECAPISTSPPRVAAPAAARRRQRLPSPE